MPTTWTNPKIKVSVIRRRKLDGTDLSPPSIFVGFLSDGEKFVATPALDNPLCLSGNNPKKWEFKTATPIILIVLFERGWIVVTEDSQEYLIEGEKMSQ